MQRRVAAACFLVFSPCIGETAFAHWYGGDPASITVVPLAGFAWSTNHPSPGWAAFAFDNFTWTHTNGGMVDTIGGYFFTHTGSPLPGVTYAQWEIRTGLSPGNPGTLIASGSGVPVLTPTGFITQVGPTGGPEPVGRVELDVPDFLLPPGNYWLGFSIGDVGAGLGGFVAETVGANGIGGPLNDGNVFYFHGDGINNPWNYVDVTATFGPMDLAYYITEIPAPSTGLVAMLAGVLMARRRR
jgi:hypothetical protein